VPVVNKQFTVVECGTPIKVLRLYASTVYRYPESEDFHFLLEYGNNTGYGSGEMLFEKRYRGRVYNRLFANAVCISDLLK